MSLEKPALAFLLDPVPSGQELPSWPTHVTVVPSMQMSVDTVLERVGDICSSQDPFMIKIGKPAMFGPRDELSGFQVEPSKELQHLHRNLLRALGGSAVVAGAREDWLGDNYSPHIIPKQGCSAVIEEGEIFLVDRLHVVARKSNDMKVVAGVLNLGGVQ